MEMRTAVALMAVILAGCDAAGSWPAYPPTRPKLGVSNGTTLTVTLVVNGQRIADFPARGPQPTIDVAELPPLPWKVEAHSPSGRVLTSMGVEPGDVQTTTDGDGVAGYSGTMGRVDLSCGRLTIWAGDIQPSGPAPPASPGTPGDCAP
jgi:hypothetical protein